MTTNEKPKKKAKPKTGVIPLVDNHGTSEPVTFTPEDNESTYEPGEFNARDNHGTSEPVK
ncbi:hypothetical protein [Streptomyces gobiensis]|uniref:hypothetical protein n=1 Tax=Streptomyces gobiensis TaxID=2875706 RepID=UPI001E65C3E3|nr:hypothetical protein [Streptomyces gobiensis]UGY91995.1 hypothetical protein test1122_09860 [Streptomyces gobiensis]